MWAFTTMLGFLMYVLSLRKGITKLNFYIERTISFSFFNYASYLLFEFTNHQRGYILIAICSIMVVGYCVKAIIELLKLKE